MVHFIYLLPMKSFIARGSLKIGTPAYALLISTPLTLRVKRFRFTWFSNDVPFHTRRNSFCRRYRIFVFRPAENVHAVNAFRRPSTFHESKSESKRLRPQNRRYQDTRVQ